MCLRQLLKGSKKTFDPLTSSSVRKLWLRPKACSGLRQGATHLNEKQMLLVTCLNKAIVTEKNTAASISAHQTSLSAVSSVSYTAQTKMKIYRHIWFKLKTRAPSPTIISFWLERQRDRQRRGMEETAPERKRDPWIISSHQVSFHRERLFTEMRPFASLSAGLISELVPC